MPQLIEECALNTIKFTCRYSYNYSWACAIGMEVVGCVDGKVGVGGGVDGYACNHIPLGDAWVKFVGIVNGVINGDILFSIFVRIYSWR